MLLFHGLHYRLLNACSCHRSRFFLRAVGLGQRRSVSLSTPLLPHPASRRPRGLSPEKPERLVLLPKAKTVQGLSKPDDRTRQNSGQDDHRAEHPRVQQVSSAPGTDRLLFTQPKRRAHIIQRLAYLDHSACMACLNQNLNRRDADDNERAQYLYCGHGPCRKRHVDLEQADGGTID